MTINIKHSIDRTGLKVTQFTDIETEIEVHTSFCQVTIDGEELTAGILNELRQDVEYLEERESELEQENEEQVREIQGVTDDFEELFTKNEVNEQEIQDLRNQLEELEK